MTARQQYPKKGDIVDHCQRRENPSWGICGVNMRRYFRRKTQKPESRDQGILFSQDTGKGRFRTKYKARGLTVQERQAIRRLQGYEG